MDSIVMYLIMALLLTSACAVVIAVVDGPKSCQQCDMDRTVYARSRMLILYADGTSTGVCSINCATAELQNNRDKQVVSILAADYISKELIDARTAIGVIGGRQKDVMTNLENGPLPGLRRPQNSSQETLEQ